MSRERILVTGGTGFIGAHVLPLLRQAAPPGRPAPELRLLTHRRPTVPHPEDPDGAVETATGDLADPGTLRGVCDGVTTVLHLAARVGGTEEECRAVNEEGTRALLAEAARSGVRRVVQLGTAAVYGDGEHRAAPEDSLPEAPVSVTSVTRLAGERLVLAAGGTVVRPYLVYGDGDRWVVPSLLRLLEHIPHWVDGGTARISMISAPVLASALTELALAPEPSPGPRVLHAAHPQPVSVRELITAVCRALERDLPDGDLTAAEARARLTDPAARRSLDLLTHDHWYDAGRLWSTVTTDPGPGFTEDFAAHAPWYRKLLQS
ncbi:NAD(P)-dependent oxidoreductase [Streptomyces sp. XM83C]|uniref:NAD-dependent epimerase/dehydratase family protein n=1 Tax=Streptomyces thermocoprophilus TaxID=78356 RepID=A0ABV5VFJ9_9ACTN|nr:NAD(P)-dependent oxidoreductase [Streptomyces sp. XM83C]MCK1819488.1 NAD(P)-dependent oxidoreductase [Streptomyces sp. XM83C]